MTRGSKTGVVTVSEATGLLRAEAYPPDNVRTGELEAAVRPESGRSGLEGT